MDKMMLYNHLPIWAQNLACCYEGWQQKKLRFNEAFVKTLHEYESHNSWSYEQICDYRDAQLRKIVRHSYDTVPYYHKLFHEGGINPDSIRTLDDMKRLPVLTKNTINKDPKQFLSSKYPLNALTTFSTSGSTGSSLVLRILPECIARHYAMAWHFRKRLGISFDTWHSEFGSRIIVPPGQKKPPYWRTSTPLKQVMFSAFHGNPSTFITYYEKMRKDRFSWISGTPSVLIPFAMFCVNNHLIFDHKIKFVTTNSENLYVFQRKILMKAFGVSPHTYYNLTEGVASFSENQDGIIEVNEDHAAVEFIKENDFYHITGTSLINYAMPLLRYDSGDIAFVSGKIGRYGRVVDRIDGRTGDCILLKDGTHVATLSALFSETEHIMEAQIHQQKDYSLVIQYVPKDDAFESDLEKVHSMLNDRIAGALPVRFERVDKIQRTARGKLRYIVSDVITNSNSKLAYKEEL